MSEFIVYIFFISLWNVILFYGKSYGISVLLFMIPLMIMLYFVFKKNNLIKNKKGLLLMIPILLLSLSYYIFNSSLFYYLNIPVIVLLIVLMYIYTVRPTYKLSQIFNDIIFLLFDGLSYVGKWYTLVINKITNNSKLSENGKRNIKSALIIIPIVLVVLVLLMHADIIFKDLFKGIIDILNSINLFDGILGKIIVFIFIFFTIGCTLMNLTERYLDSHKVEMKPFNKDSNTIKWLIISLDIIYIVFDYIQIKSLMLHKVSSGIDYATYARQGFFELLVVSIINITIILLSKKFKNSSIKDNKLINIMSILMILLTFVIIVSSFLRMNLYESVYGYTMLRLLVYIILLTETILLIPTVMYIINPNVEIFKYYMIIIICVYTSINYCNLDYLIAKRNVNRYYNSSMEVKSKNKNLYLDEYDYSYLDYEFNNLDLIYLSNDKTDNINILIDLYNNTNDPYMIDYLNHYFDELKSDKDYKWQEYNLSKCNAYKQINILKRRTPQF